MFWCFKQDRWCGVWFCEREKCEFEEEQEDEN